MYFIAVVGVLNVVFGVVVVLEVVSEVGVEVLESFMIAKCKKYVFTIETTKLKLETLYFGALQQSK